MVWPACVFLCSVCCASWPAGCIMQTALERERDKQEGLLYLWKCQNIIKPTTPSEGALLEEEGIREGSYLKGMVSKLHRT